MVHETLCSRGSNEPMPTIKRPIAAMTAIVSQSHVIRGCL
jgi:hypothetical protein